MTGISVGGGAYEKLQGSTALTAAITSPTGPDDEQIQAILASIHNTPLATVVTDLRQPDNPIIEANEPFTLLTGYARDEILGRNCRFLAGRGTEPEARDALREAVANGQPKLVELTNYRKDGSAFRNAVMIAPVRDRSGNIVLFVGSQMEVRSTDDIRLRREHSGAQIAALTPRQRQVLELVAAGYLNKQIGHMLGISPRTVEVHRAGLIEALNVSSSADAIRIAVEAYLVRSPHA